MQSQKDLYFVLQSSRSNTKSALINANQAMCCVAFARSETETEVRVLLSFVVCLSINNRMVFCPPFRVLALL